MDPGARAFNSHSRHPWIKTSSYTWAKFIRNPSTLLASSASATAYCCCVRACTLHHSRIIKTRPGSLHQCSDRCLAVMLDQLWLQACQQLKMWHPKYTQPLPFRRHLSHHVSLSTLGYHTESLQRVIKLQILSPLKQDKLEQFAYKAYGLQIRPINWNTNLAM